MHRLHWPPWHWQAGLSLLRPTQPPRPGLCQSGAFQPRAGRCAAGGRTEAPVGALSGSPRARPAGGAIKGPGPGPGCHWVPHGHSGSPRAARSRCARRARPGHAGPGARVVTGSEGGRVLAPCCWHCVVPPCNRAPPRPGPGPGPAAGPVGIMIGARARAPRSLGHLGCYQTAGCQ